MKIYDKIRKIRKEKGLSLVALEKRLVEIFGKKALRYNTIYRIEKGMRNARPSSLSQICLGLGISLQELREGTREDVPQIATHFKKRHNGRQYIYSEKAKATILSTNKLPFLAKKLMLDPGGATKLEQDPLEQGKFEKWLYCLKGKITVNIGVNKFEVAKDEALFFESTLPHCFANTGSSKASCIVIQNPRHI